MGVLPWLRWKPALISLGRELGCQLEFFQSNHEGELVDCIQACRDGVGGILINPAAYTHYSYAIGMLLPQLICQQWRFTYPMSIRGEDFRHRSVTAPVCSGQGGGI